MGENADPNQAFILPGHIQRGDPAPWWKQGLHRFAFDPAAGRYIVLSFYGTARDAVGQMALDALDSNRRFIDDGTARRIDVTLTS